MPGRAVRGPRIRPRRPRPRRPQGFPEVVFGQGKTPAQIAPHRPRDRRARPQPARHPHGRRRLRGGSRKSCRMRSFTSTRGSSSAAPTVPRGTGVILVAAAELLTYRWPRKRPSRPRSWATTSTGCTTSASPASIACSPNATASTARPGHHRRSPAWRARCRASSAGWCSAPVIAVPTSVGYGASFGGLTALLAMLNSCATGVSVVNIDNGFGAAAIASEDHPQSVMRSSVANRCLSMHAAARASSSIAVRDALARRGVHPLGRARALALEPAVDPDDGARAARR